MCTHGPPSRVPWVTQRAPRATSIAVSQEAFEEFLREREQLHDKKEEQDTVTEPRATAAEDTEERTKRANSLEKLLPCFPAAEESHAQRSKQSHGPIWANGHQRDGPNIYPPQIEGTPLPHCVAGGGHAYFAASSSSTHTYNLYLARQ